MMTIAGDYRMTGGGQGADAGAAKKERSAVLEEAAEIYELYTIALYDLDGKFLQGIDGAPESLDDSFFGLLKETDNLTTDPCHNFPGQTWRYYGHAGEGKRRDFHVYRRSL